MEVSAMYSSLFIIAECWVVEENSLQVFYSDIIEATGSPFGVVVISTYLYPWFGVSFLDCLKIAK